MTQCGTFARPSASLAECAFANHQILLESGRDFKRVLKSLQTQRIARNLLVWLIVLKHFALQIGPTVLHLPWQHDEPPKRVAKEARCGEGQNPFLIERFCLFPSLLTDGVQKLVAFERVTTLEADPGTGRVDILKSGYRTALSLIVYPAFDDLRTIGLHRGSLCFSGGGGRLPQGVRHSHIGTAHHNGILREPPLYFPRPSMPTIEITSSLPLWVSDDRTSDDRMSNPCAPCDMVASSGQNHMDKNGGPEVGIMIPG